MSKGGPYSDSPRSNNLPTAAPMRTPNELGHAVSKCCAMSKSGLYSDSPRFDAALKGHPNDE